MRLRVVIATAALAALSPVVVPTGIASAASRCSARGSITLAASRAARVYYLPKRAPRKPPRGTTGLPGRTFACLYSSGKRVPLGTRADRVLLSFHLAGQFVALTASDRSSSRIAVVEVVDIRRGRMTLRNHVPNASVTSLVVAPNGSSAWIRTTDDNVASLTKYETGAGTTVVDPGPNIAIHSLALALGSQTYADANAAIYWTNTGQPFSAPLH